MNSAILETQIWVLGLGIGHTIGDALMEYTKDEKNNDKSGQTPTWGF
jgi:hypothetical protein